MIDKKATELKQASLVYDLEMYLRTFIIEQDIKEDKLAELLGLLPVGVEVLWAKRWRIRNCLEVANALGLVIEFKLSND